MSRRRHSDPAGESHSPTAASKAPKASRPPETALNHPAAGEEDEAVLSVRELAHLQADAHRGRILGRLCPGIALIDKGADFKSKDQYGYTPLQRAIANGRIEIVQLLLAYGREIR